jgi:hypothetical protein
MKIKKPLKIFLVTFCSVLVVLFSVLVFLAQASFSFISTNGVDTSRNNLLKSLVEQNSALAEAPITKIALLGAHDSLSYDINYYSQPNSSEDTISNNKFVYNTCRGFIARYSKTQMEDVYTQLCAGVRYIDARITNIGGVFYTSHGVVSGTLEKSLLQILKFLDENPGEYILFHIVHFYPGQSSWAELDEYISSVKYNDKSLFDYVNYDAENTQTIGQVTYNLMTENGTKAGVMMFGSHTNNGGEFDKFYKLTKYVSSPWFNNTNSKVQINAIAEQYEKAKEYSDDYLCIMQTQVSPNFDSPFSTLFGWSVSDMNAKHNSKVVSDERFSKWLSAMPIYLCDYSTASYKDFNKTAIAKIVEYNLKYSISD